MLQQQTFCIIFRHTGSDATLPCAAGGEAWLWRYRKEGVGESEDVTEVTGSILPIRRVWLFSAHTAPPLGSSLWTKWDAIWSSFVSLQLSVQFEMFNLTTSSVSRHQCKRGEHSLPLLISYISQNAYHQQVWPFSNSKRLRVPPVEKSENCLII